MSVHRRPSQLSQEFLASNSKIFCKEKRLTICIGAVSPKEKDPEQSEPALRLSQDYVLKHNFPDSDRQNLSYQTSLFSSRRSSRPSTPRISSPRETSKIVSPRSTRVTRNPKDNTRPIQTSASGTSPLANYPRAEIGGCALEQSHDGNNQKNKTINRKRIQRLSPTCSEMQTAANHEKLLIQEEYFNNSPRFTNAGLEENRIVKKTSKGKISDLRVVSKDTATTSWTAFGLEEEEISSSISLSFSSLPRKLEEDTHSSSSTKNASPRWTNYHLRMSKMLLSKKRSGTYEEAKSPLSTLAYSSIDEVALDSLSIKLKLNN